MSKFLKLAVFALGAMAMWACVNNTGNSVNSNVNAGNSNANSNMTSSKAAPTLDALMALDKQANEAFTKGDSQFFQGFLSDKFAMNDMGRRVDKADTVKMIGENKCDVKSSSFDEPKMVMIDADNYAVVYKATWDATCTFQSKSQKVPSPVRAASVFTRSGDKWQGIWHGETPITDPKNPQKPPPPPPPPSNTGAKTASNSNANANSSANASSAPAADPNTDAMAAAERSGWEAWKARDANKLTELTTKDVTFVDNFGNVTNGQADVVKTWTGGNCDVKSTNLSDVGGTTISPTLGFITFKGTADGTCENMKVQPVWGTSFYVKDGNSWKLAFGFESPA